MALLHQAQLNPSKLELLSGWIFDREWFVGDAHSELSNIAAYRFDDPSGEVGVETILVRAGDGPTLQVPVTYRGSPLEGAERSLIGTMEHSVLGKRWVYDGAGDPVYLQTVASAAVNGGHQAELFVETEEGRVPRTTTALVSGTGSSNIVIETPTISDLDIRQQGSVTNIDAGKLNVRILRVVGGDGLRAGEAEPREPLATGARSATSTLSTTSTLTGTWTGSDDPEDLVLVSTT